jgi:CRISPR/Cas system-associated exonuclease Cas4 (RecB family)
LTIDNQKTFALSVSKVKTYQICKAKYKFTYLDKLPRQEWDFQIFGKFLHEVLENFHITIIDGTNDKDHVIMKQAFHDALLNWSHKLTSEQKAECYEIAAAYLKTRRHKALPVVLDVEREFSLSLRDDLLLNGFIDVVQKDPDGMLHVADYKTSKSKSYLKKDLLQLKTYAYVVMCDDSSIDRIRCSYVMLKHNFDKIEKEFDRDEIMQIKEEFIDYADKIRSEKLYRPSPTPLCKTCDYLGICEPGKDRMGLGKISFGEVEW